MIEFKIIIRYVKKSCERRQQTYMFFCAFQKEKLFVLRSLVVMTKGAIGNLINRYRAILKKCNLINVFGSLAAASLLTLGGTGNAQAYTLLKDTTVLSDNINFVDTAYGVTNTATAILDLNGYNVSNVSEKTANILGQFSPTEILP